jgi:hypothetical protein
VFEVRTPGRTITCETREDAVTLASTLDDAVIIEPLEPVRGPGKLTIAAWIESLGGHQAQPLRYHPGHGWRR